MSSLYADIKQNVKMGEIATVIHYCTNDYRFLHRLVQEASHFSSHILIPVCDHFFNGEPESYALLEETYRQFPNCTFLEFSYDSVRLYSPYIHGFCEQDRKWGFFWHSTARYIATLFLPKEIDYVLYLDADEIIEGKKFTRWLSQGEHHKYAGVRLYSFLYLGKPILRPRAFYTSALMAHFKSIDLSQMINHEDRFGIFRTLPDPKIDGLLNEEGMPFVHHYSWARSKGECLHKSKTWGHRQDRDWNREIEQLFNNPALADVLTEKIPLEAIQTPFFDPLSISIPVVPSCTQSKRERPEKKFSHVLRVNHESAWRKEIERLL